MEELKEKLLELMNTADLFRGVHSRVHEKKIFSQGFLEQIRRGANNFKDTPENKLKVQKVIDTYSQLIQERVNKIQVN